LKGSELIKLYEKGKYYPYTKEQISSLLVKMLKIVPEYCRVMRIMREIPPIYLIKGTERIDLRAEVENLLKKKKVKLKEIRYREIGFAIRDLNKGKINNNLRLKKIEYNSAGGKEIFLQFVNKDNILLRLRIRKDSSIVREIHVYGQAESIGSKSRFGIQHKGLGKKLMQEAENLTRKYKNKKIYVISGVGVREYYKKLGYYLEKEYMVKDL
jgi:elongator complex protein 3